MEEAIDNELYPGAKSKSAVTLRNDWSLLDTAVVPDLET